MADEGAAEQADVPTTRPMRWKPPQPADASKVPEMADTESASILVAAEPLQRIDRYLDDHCPGLTRAAAQRLIREARVWVNGVPAKASHMPSAATTFTSRPLLSRKRHFRRRIPCHCG